MKAYDGMYIDGAWRPAAGRDVIEVVGPADEQVIATVPAGTVEDVDAAVRAARAALPAWAATPPAERAAHLRLRHAHVYTAHSPSSSTSSGSSRTYVASDSMSSWRP
ncbi:aldehyde dehydrogenase family protein, partial [Streptomyces cellulosae]